MKILYQWLREFVDVALPPAELAERLTLCGLEVESLTRLDQGPAGIVAGKILSVEPHPNADRLSLCRVSDGTREITVVCGAPNVRAGESAPLALPGMRLPDGCNDVIIGADTDETGEREAQKAATAFTEQGRRVRIIRPLDGCKDFNEELQKGAA